MKRVLHWCFFTRNGRWWVVSGTITIIICSRLYPIALVVLAEAENPFDFLVLLAGLLGLPVFVWWFTTMILGVIVYALRPDKEDKE